VRGRVGREDSGRFLSAIQRQLMYRATPNAYRRPTVAISLWLVWRRRPAWSCRRCGGVRPVRRGPVTDRRVTKGRSHLYAPSYCLRSRPGP